MLTTENKETKAIWRIHDWLLVEYKHWAIDEMSNVNTIVIQAPTTNRWRIRNKNQKTRYLQDNSYSKRRTNNG
jgi:hypothetical protein